MKRVIYADNAATTKLDIDAFEAMKTYLLDEYGNASQPYSFSRSPKKALQEARIIIASCINAEPDEIYFTSGGTESDNWAINGTAMCDGDKHNIITSQFEHHAILRSFEAVERMGHSVTYIKPNISGIVAPEALIQVIDRPLLVSIMLANNEIGTIQPIKKLAEIAHSHGAYFHTDAVQAVGHIPVDVNELDIDMLSASAHKFNGPKGIGFLYIRKGTKISPIIHGGSQEKGVRAGTENVASIVGMAIALKKNCDSLTSSCNHIKKVSAAFLNALDFEYILNGNENKLAGINSISIKGASGEALLHLLDLKGIIISTGSACDSINTQVSHVLKAIDIPDDLALGTIRISFDKNNTIEEAVTIAQILNKLVKL